MSADEGSSMMLPLQIGGAIAVMAIGAIGDEVLVPLFNNLAQNLSAMLGLNKPAEEAPAGDGSAATGGDGTTVTSV